MIKTTTSVLSILVFLTSSPWSRADQPILRKIKVSAETERKVVPDIATVDLTITTESPNRQDAINATALKSKSVLDSLANDQIQRKFIKSVWIGSSPVYSNGTLLSEKKLTGYKASHYLEVTVDKMDSIGQILDHAINSGVTQVSRIQTHVSTESKIKNELQVEAVKMAREKAEKMTLAEGTDLKVGSAIEILDRIERPTALGYGGYPPTLVAPAAVAAVAASSANPFENFTPGERLIHTDVTVVFELKSSK